ncbi:MAG: type II secretion system minor pseudopilin GspI [Burkholderiaceae bacterium]
MSPAPPQTGFTLLEVLVALAIASIALVACLRALAVSTNGAQAMQQRSLALLAAENRLAELRLQRAFPPAGRRIDRCQQGALALSCEQVFQNTVNGNFRQVTIRVRLPDGPVLAQLDGLLSPLP